MERQWNDKIFNSHAGEFESLCLEAFRYQAENLSIYTSYIRLLGIDPVRVQSLSEIPFLPISFFKTHRVETSGPEAELVFESSGTTGMTVSRHFVKDPDLYRESFRKGFELVFGDISQYCVLGLLPSYLERSSSSLVYMVDDLVKYSGDSRSGFYLDQLDELSAMLARLEAEQKPTLLFGVSFALLDLAEKLNMQLRYTKVIETGGMKGRRKEMIRAELHDKLIRAFGLPAVCSEYGMTELLSQGWSEGGGIFRSPPWMQILLRDEEDPLTVRNYQSINKEFASGAVNVVDLANIHSCCFIATDDAGRLYPDGSFEILGRIDNSDIRGCSLMLL